MIWLGEMATADGTWHVQVGGVGFVSWYRLVGPGVKRNLPSLTALTNALDKMGVEVAELHEVGHGRAGH